MHLFRGFFIFKMKTTSSLLWTVPLRPSQLVSCCLPIALVDPNPKQNRLQNWHRENLSWERKFRNSLGFFGIPTINFQDINICGLVGTWSNEPTRWRIISHKSGRYLEIYNQTPTPLNILHGKNSFNSWRRKSLFLNESLTWAMLALFYVCMSPCWADWLHNPVWKGHLALRKQIRLTLTLSPPFLSDMLLLNCSQARKNEDFHTFLAVHYMFQCTLV